MGPAFSESNEWIAEHVSLGVHTDRLTRRRGMAGLLQALLVGFWQGWKAAHPEDFGIERWLIVYRLLFAFFHDTASLV
jgi:hypothetical protein